MSGAWVFVCGPSGAGKDSVIAHAREQLAGNADVVFAQRLMTRPAAASADHQGLAVEQFEAVLRGHELAWHWQAHGNHYGIAERYARQVDWGRVVVVNGSREHAATLPRGDGLRVVLVTANPGDIAARLVRRGRDTPEDVARRLARNAQLDEVGANLVIANDGRLTDAAAVLADYLAGTASTERASITRSSTLA